MASKPLKDQKLSVQSTFSGHVSKGTWVCRKATAGGELLFIPMKKNATIERLEAIERHVGEDAYFATTATVLDLQQQELASPRSRRGRTVQLLQKTIECLRRTRDELMYLQENYRIVRRRTRQ
jgi:hypothetical protein